MEIRTLLLNAQGMPHAILSWKDAICLMYENEKKVRVLEEYDETVSSPSITMYVPAVMMLTRKIPAFKRGVNFTRKNVLIRDNFTCQYCGIKPDDPKGLTYDHVAPRVHGGKTNWLNIVISCMTCNSKKGSKTPEQANMRLLRKPAKPHSLPLHTVFFKGTDVPDAWKPYLNLDSA
jgi:5-methylcytosine-specific restriction endonuclease McrA